MFGLASSLLVIATSLFAANRPAPTTLIDTNLLDPQIVAANPQVKHLMEELKKEGIKTDDLLDERFLFASLPDIRGRLSAIAEEVTRPPTSDL